MSWTATDHALMARALLLAERGAATTHPNPRVGCVIARGEEIVGEGWHRFAGGPHAEVYALEAAGEAARGATVYVSLEPCAHQGRTGPCARALVKAGVARVLAAVGDPYPDVAGRGLQCLEEAGIETSVGLLAEQAEALNAGFLSRIRRGRPWIRVKLAMSLDGRTALPSGESRWISSESSRADVQRWRARASALLTGIGTVRRDDPRLDVRIAAERQPSRVVVDPSLSLSPQARLLSCGGPVLLVASAQTQVPAWMSERGLEIIAVDHDGESLDLATAMAELARREVNELQVEAGEWLCGTLLKAGLVDELLIYLAPHLLGAGKGLVRLPELTAMSDRVRLRWHRVDRIGDDIRIQARPCSPD